MSKVYGTLKRSTETPIEAEGFSPRMGVEYITKILLSVYPDQICKLGTNSLSIKSKQYVNTRATKLFTLDTLCPLTLNATVYTNIIALRIRELH